MWSRLSQYFFLPDDTIMIDISTLILHLVVLVTFNLVSCSDNRSCMVRLDSFLNILVQMLISMGKTEYFEVYCNQRVYAINANVS